MRDILPSCFGGRDGFRAHELVGGRLQFRNLVTCLYNAKLIDEYIIVYVTWCKTRIGQGFFVHMGNPAACRLTCNVDMKPWRFWKKQGCKSFERAGLKVEVMWDLSCAKYMSGPEPHDGYYVIITCEQNVVLLLGDMPRAALKKVHAEHAASPATVLLSRREHISGKQLYATKAQFSDNGRFHDVVIECQTGSEKEWRLSVCIDKQIVVQTKQLMWNFRGNRTVFIDGLPILVFWDVYDWLFNPSDGAGHAVFMFQTCMTNEKPWTREVGLLSMTLLQDSAMTSSCHDNADRKRYLHQESPCSSKLHWPLSNSFKNKVQHEGPLGFSLILYAWRIE